MVRRYARAPRGQRCRIAVPQGHYQDHHRHRRAACLGAAGHRPLKDGATTGAHFRSYVADTLAPALRPGDTVIMDNLRPQGGGRAEALETVGSRLLYLPPPLATPSSFDWRGPWRAPPYSPDFNPIEQLFAKLKALLRTAAARTIPALWQTIREAFTRFRPDECGNYIAASGYDACMIGIGSI